MLFKIMASRYINQPDKKSFLDLGYDKGLIIAVALLIIFGLLFLSSASSVYSYNKFSDPYYFVKHQIEALIIGILAFLILSKINYHRWQKYALWFLIFSIFLLLLVFIPGLSRHYGKARSWINIFGFSLQPSEFVKLSFLIYLAAWLETKKDKLTKFSEGTRPFLIVLSIIALLMVLQPDIGTLSIIAATSLVVYFIGGGNLKYILAIIFISLFLFSIMVLIWQYQLNRFKCVFNPGFSPQDICYQTNQSLIAVGSGGILGRGFGDSRQKLLYLPEVQGDSIFAIIAEESGMIISSLLLLTYLYIFYRGYIIAQKAPDDFGRILAIGIVSWITIQAIINIGGIINLMPMTGVPLPFISYGGTSILSTMMALGILVNISKNS